MSGLREQRFVYLQHERGMPQRPFGTSKPDDEQEDKYADTWSPRSHGVE